MPERYRAILILRVLGVASHELEDLVREVQIPIPASERTLRLAREWLSRCYASHNLCQSSRDDFVPTRLIKIESNGEYRCTCNVDQFLQERDNWAALSYVWGGNQAFTTTSSTLSDMYTKFPIRRLPYTFQDTCLVCKGLGLKYLWFDCLCIIQDDAEDLVKELQDMPKVYQRAWVTISASTAANVRDNFLSYRGYKPEREKSEIMSILFQ